VGVLVAVAGTVKGGVVGVPFPPGVGVRVFVANEVGVGVDVTFDVGVGGTTRDGVYVLTEITAGSTVRFRVYINHLPVVGSLKVVGVA
jgi:hypothetical protein